MFIMTFLWLTRGQVKDSLFKNPALGALLRNAGNIRAYIKSHSVDVCLSAVAVDRKNKNNQSLFRGTFQGSLQYNAPV